MKPDRYSCPYEEWDVDREAGTFRSPHKDRGWDRVVVFPYRISDGSISASITAIEGQWNEQPGYEFQECAFLFRYADQGRFYTAGIGGFGRKFYIGKSLRLGSPWQLLQAQGEAKDVGKGKVYDLRVEFVGPRLTLYVNDAPMITSTDAEYVAGLCGLRAYRTQGEFANVEIQLFLKKTCFVIMPFDPRMKRIYDLINETVQEQGLICRRADDRFVSQAIVDDVKAQIASADLVIVDFTGRNPNVYYEAGLADALGKKWVVLAQSKSDLAFDVEHIRAIVYSDDPGQEAQFRDDLGRALRQTLDELGDLRKTAYR